MYISSFIGDSNIKFNLILLISQLNYTIFDLSKSCFVGNFLSVFNASFYILAASELISSVELINFTTTSIFSFVA